MKALRHLVPYLRTYRRPYLLGSLTVFFSSLFLAIKPRLVQIAIDGPHGSEGADGSFQLLCAGGIVGVMIVRGVFLFLTRKLMIVASRRIENDLRNDYFQKLQTLTPGFFHANPTGDLMARATNDLAAVRQMLGPGIMYSVNTLLSGTFVLVNLFMISTLLTLACLATLPIMAFAVYWFGRAIHDRFETIQDQFGTLTARSQENLAGVRTVRAYAREEHEEELFDEANSEYVRLNRGFIRVESAFRPAIMLCAGLGSVVMLYVGGSFMISGRLTEGEFLAFAIYLGLLVWPVVAVGWVTGLFQRGAASMKRINRVMETEPLVLGGSEAIGAGVPAAAVPTAAPAGHSEACDSAGRAVTRDPAGRAVTRDPAGRAVTRDPAGRPGARDPADHRIEIRDLDFRYNEDGPLVLKGIDAVIEPGRTTAIVGPTGAGKTTLLNLLGHLYPIERGKILVGGKDINDLDLGSLRRLFGVVSQEVFLFSDTIEHNIAFAERHGKGGGNGLHSRRSFGSVEEAARLAAFDAEVDALADRYGTLLGERGINLSGGQKQRCAIARALHADPEILVLDDALSAVDTNTEDVILKNLAAVAEGRTVIIVSHRVSAVRDADQILVLRDGAIEERGVHDELVRAGGLYADMVEQQRLKSELEVI